MRMHCRPFFLNTLNTDARPQNCTTTNYTITRYTRCYRSYPVQYEQKQPGAVQVVHTHPTSYRCGWPTGFGAVILVLTLQYLLPRLSEFQASPLLMYFRDGPHRCVHRTNYGTILIRYVTLHFRDWRGEASLLHRISSATTVLLCENRSTIRFDFRSRRKRYRVWCELSLKLWNPLVYKEKLNWYFYKRSSKNRA